MKYHALGYELERPEMRVLLDNAVLSDVRATGILKSFDPASIAGRRAMIRVALASQHGSSTGVAHRIGGDMPIVRAERDAILAHLGETPVLERRPDRMNVLVGSFTLGWTLEGIRSYTERDSEYIREPVVMNSIINAYDEIEATRGLSVVGLARAPEAAIPHIVEAL